MFQGKALVATAQGAALVFGSIILVIIGFTLLNPLMVISQSSIGTSNVAFGMPIIFMVLAALAFLVGLQRFYSAHKYSHLAMEPDGKNPVLESYSEEDEALQEKLREESEEQNIA